jgi:hypothetical protein
MEIWKIKNILQAKTLYETENNKNAKQQKSKCLNWKIGN